MGWQVFCCLSLLSILLPHFVDISFLEIGKSDPRECIEEFFQEIVLADPFRSIVCSLITIHLSSFMRAWPQHYSELLQASAATNQWEVSDLSLDNVFYLCSILERAVLAQRDDNAEDQPCRAVAEHILDISGELILRQSFSS